MPSDLEQRIARLTAKPTYIGPERRKADRRSNADRRQSVRFEVNNNDRRKNFGRRSTDTFFSNTYIPGGELKADELKRTSTPRGERPFAPPINYAKG